MKDLLMSHGFPQGLVAQAVVMNHVALSAMVYIVLCVILVQGNHVWSLYSREHGGPGLRTLLTDLWSGH